MCGHLVGAVPPGWLEGRALGQCTVCSRLLSRRYGNTCPRCRPALARPAVPMQGRPLPDGCPTLDEVCAAPIGVRRHVPKGAQNLWAQCLLTAAAGVVEFNDTRAWTEFMALPKMVLVAETEEARATAAEPTTTRSGDAEIGWRANGSSCGGPLTEVDEQIGRPRMKPARRSVTGEPGEPRSSSVRVSCSRPRQHWFRRPRFASRTRSNRRCDSNTLRLDIRRLNASPASG